MKYENFMIMSLQPILSKVLIEFINYFIKMEKKIDSNLYTYLISLALAIWLSDDGCWTKYGVRIATNAFTLKEVQLLIQMLNNKFGLVCTTQKINTINQYSIYIRSKSMNNLKN